MTDKTEIPLSESSFDPTMVYSTMLLELGRAYSEVFASPKKNGAQLSDSMESAETADTDDKTLNDFLGFDIASISVHRPEQRKIGRLHCFEQICPSPTRVEQHEEEQDSELTSKDNTAVDASQPMDLLSRLKQVCDEEELSAGSSTFAEQEFASALAKATPSPALMKTRSRGRKFGGKRLFRVETVANA